MSEPTEKDPVEETTEAEDSASRLVSRFLKTIARNVPAAPTGAELNLHADQWAQFRDCVAATSKSFGVRRNISKKEIESLLHDAVQASIGRTDQPTTRDKARAKAALEGFVARLQLPTRKWIVALAYDEVATKRRIAVGPVVLRPMPNDRGLWRVVWGVAVPPEANHWLDGMRGRRTLATVAVETVDNTAAAERGRLLVDSVLGLVRLFDPSAARRTQDRAITTRSLAKDHFSFSRPTLIKPTDAQRARAKINRTSWRSVLGFLRSPDPSEIEQRILRALRWSLQASHAFDAGVALLQYVIAIETLLGSAVNNRNSGKTEIAYRAAWLFTHSSERSRVSEEVLALYNERNEIAHGGDLDDDPRRAEARRLLGEIFEKLTGRKELCSMSSKEFDQYWGRHRLE